jgi:hypothetical protein
VQIERTGRLCVPDWFAAGRRNVGRLASAAAPFLVGSLAQEHGFGVAFAMLAGALLIGAATWIWLPETRGRTLA